MKALILTHPLGTNYGGAMQCYALSVLLAEQGYEVEVADMYPTMSRLKRFIKAILLFAGYYKETQKRFSGISAFVKSHLKLTRKLYSSADLESYIKGNNISLVVVGSDQVWKASFAMSYGYSYFLDIQTEGVKKIAYAASIGSNKWDYSYNETQKIKILCRSFSGISVREDDAVDLLEKNVGIKAFHVLDPTLMISHNLYNSMCSQRLPKKKYVFVYWLWNKEMIQKTVEEIKQKYNYDIVELSMRETKNLPTVDQWLSLIKYSEYVITDSFHGCAFAINFKRPFQYVRHPDVYDSRRESLLKMLEIDSSKFSESNVVQEYARINSRKVKKQIESLDFLKANIW